MTAASFAICPLEILSDDALTHLDKIVFSALKSHARPGKPLVWPSRSRIARLAGCTVTSVSRSLKRLVAAGWILVTRTGRANRVTCFDAPQVTSEVTPESHRHLYIEKTIEAPLTPNGGGGVQSHQETLDAIEQPASSQETLDAIEQPASHQETQNQAIVFLAWFNTQTEARLDSSARPLQRMVNRRLRTHTPEQLRLVVAFYASLWANTPLAQHARNLRTVLSPMRIELALSEISRQETQREQQQAKLWRPTETKKADPSIVRTSLDSLRRLLR